ncbi:helix-turn-helix domain-containing protein [Noviherbaspirillum sp. 17J57-3]|uniref:Helix-turn-helix domain-containing protein n=1 Tax=Noviherbaspirillum galbum TaxID=2709383 RepID=A0A6B3SN84_9BURK|nr:helix-turn-helix domain-containing protein [Noviherbaspirillum galbum]
MEGENTARSLAPYDPNRLLDYVKKRFNLKNDAALCRVLRVTAPVISKIRHGRLPVGAALLINIHEMTDLPVRELRDIMGDRRQIVRISPDHTKPREEGDQ